jgi:MFS family permease
VISGIALMASCLMLTSLSATTSLSWLFASYVVFGIGFGFVNAPITTAAVSGMPRAQAGVASAIASTSRQVGATLGVAVVGAMITASLGEATHVESAAVIRSAWWVLAGCGALVLVLGLVVTTPWANRTAERTAEELNPEFLEGVIR